MSENKRPPKPWEQQENETIRAYAAFRIYRDLGVDRSLTKVCRELGISSKSSAETWSSQHSWVKRIEAYEAAQDVIRRREMRRSQNEMARRHATMAAGLQNKVLARLKGLDIEEMKVSEMLRAFDLSTKIEIKARQIPLRDIIPEDSEVQQHVDDLEDDETQVAQAVRDMRAEAAGKPPDPVVTDNTYETMPNADLVDATQGDADASDAPDAPAAKPKRARKKAVKDAATPKATMQVIKGGQNGG